MDLLASLLVSMAVALFAVPFVRSRLRHSTALRRRAELPWVKEERWYERLLHHLGLANADQLCQYAGRPMGLTGLALLQYQFVLALLAAFCFGLVSVGFGGVMGILAWFMPRLLLSAMAQQRRARIVLELPAFLDLWGLLVASGEGIETALLEICKRHPDWMLSSEIRRALDRISASGLFGESLVEEAKVTGSPEFIAVAEQIRHLTEGGGLPSRELARMAEQMREGRISELIQSAGAMAIVGIFPKLGAVFLSLLPVLAAILLTVKQQL